MSFGLQKDGTNLFEVDLGLFYQRSKFYESETKISFYRNVKHLMSLNSWILIRWKK